MCKKSFFLLFQYLLIFILVDQNGSYAYDPASNDSYAKEARYDTDEEINWSKFLTMDRILHWMRKVTYDHKHDHYNISRVKVGTTYEKRNIYGISITSNDREKRPGVILEVGMEGPHDALVISAAIWMVNELLNDDFLDPIWTKFDYLFIPVVNVDSYQYSMSSGGEIRYLTRKSRRPLDEDLGKSFTMKCYGVHLNRNWGNENLYDDSNPCGEFYAGRHPFSEIETYSLSTYYKSNRRSDIFISLQSKGQSILYPDEEKLPRTDLWRKIASDAAAAAWKEVKEEQLFSDLDDYEFGPFNRYRVPRGGSAQWYYEELNPTLTFIIKLRAKAYNLLQPASIVPSGKELKVIIETMLKSYPTAEESDSNSELKN